MCILTFAVGAPARNIATAFVNDYTRVLEHLYCPRDSWTSTSKVNGHVNWQLATGTVFKYFIAGDDSSRISQRGDGGGGGHTIWPIFFLRKIIWSGGGGHVFLALQLCCFEVSLSNQLGKKILLLSKGWIFTLTDSDGEWAILKLYYFHS